MPFPNGFVPEFPLRAPYSDSQPNWIIIFVGQNLRNDSEKEEYERTYFMIEFPKSIDGSIGHPIEYVPHSPLVRKISKGNNSVIGATCCLNYRGNPIIWVFYQIGTSIEYCIQIVDFNIISVDHSVSLLSSLMIELSIDFLSN